MNIGDRIKARRVQLGLSQEELAARLGYKSRSTINKIELGVNDITQSKVSAIAKALDTTSAYLMGWDDEKPLSVSAEGLSDIKRDLIDKIMAMDDETVAALNRIADQVLSLRDK